MKFDKILSNNKLWAVRYERERSLLLQEGAIDADGFTDYLSEISDDYLYETENS